MPTRRKITARRSDALTGAMTVDELYVFDAWTPAQLAESYGSESAAFERMEVLRRRGSLRGRPALWWAMAEGIPEELRGDGPGLKTGTYEELELAALGRDDLERRRAQWLEANG